MHTLQCSNPDSLEPNQKKVRGDPRRKMLERCWGSTYHGGARAKVQKLGDQGVNVKTHDLGCFQ
jgi:hypothetical protein